MSVQAPSKVENIAAGVATFFFVAAAACMITTVAGAILKNNSVMFGAGLGAAGSTLVGLLSISLANHLMFKRTFPQYIRDT